MEKIIRISRNVCLPHYYMKSHVAKISIEIKDLLALKQAAKDLGLEFVEQKTYRWFGRHVGDFPLPAGFKTSDLGKCDYVLRIPNNDTAYEIGVVKRKDGKPGYELLWDFWSGGYGLQAVVGDNGTKLVQSYAAAVTTNLYKKQGFRVTKSVTKDGAIRLVANK